MLREPPRRNRRVKEGADDEGWERRRRIAKEVEESPPTPMVILQNHVTRRDTLTSVFALQSWSHILTVHTSNRHQKQRSDKRPPKHKRKKEEEERRKKEREERALERLETTRTKRRGTGAETDMAIRNMIMYALSLPCLAAAAAVVRPRTDGTYCGGAMGPNATSTTTRAPGPVSWNVYPQQRSLSRGPSSGFEVQSYGNRSSLEQVLVFSGIPDGAESCTLGWSQGSREDRVFLVDGEYALVKVTQLSGIPKDDEPITYDSIEPYVKAADDDAEAAPSLSPDFTSWDDVQGPSDHVAGGVRCAGDIYLKMELYDPTTPAHVYLSTDEENGFWIEYTCGQ
ncbi:hypothetical protein GMORB2_1683 [Geosmithia morbida]|uniref:Uncharacterized protein n=1 Tax=Geosmithia morbida TaxID=1094350 RepID=A0A9P4YUC4_9HYPO|nr:uncharacterized protein GMORB2_1683 [Geosmithia morbida]KAF4121843.1 hypothetical protein GMORB2_1683 [Geosmithia morbida]